MPRDLHDAGAACRPSLGLGLTTFAMVCCMVACTEPSGAQDRFARARQAMVRTQLVPYGIRDSATLRVMGSVPRHEFVPAAHRDRAYGDHPLPIGLGQTISQPYVVAFMTELARAGPRVRVLEVGTGSGYQAAILAALGAEVYTIEIFEELADAARDRLARLGYRNVQVRHGDGFDGWKEAAPFDAILVTAAAGHIPPPLVAQLASGGRLLIPVGNVQGAQNLILAEKSADGAVRTRNVLPVRFVPLLRGLR